MGELITKSLGLLIPIIAIFMSLLIAIISIILEHRKKHHLADLCHAERLAAIDKGIELPDYPSQLFINHDRTNPLRRGFMLLLIGTSVCVALYIKRGDNWVWGLIPAAIGLAYLLTVFFSNKHKIDLKVNATTKFGQ